MTATMTEIRAEIETPLTDAELQSVADRMQARLERAFGPAWTDASTTVTESHPGYRRSIFLRRRISSVVSVTEYSSLLDITGTAVVEGESFFAWLNEGRLERMTAKWGARITVVYKPQDDRDRWKDAIIDLVRLRLARTAVKRESVGGEYSFEAPDSWDREEAKVLRRAGFPAEVF